MKIIRPLATAAAVAALLTFTLPDMAHAMSHPLSVTYQGTTQSIILNVDGGQASVSLNGTTLEGRVRNTNIQDGQLVGLSATLSDDGGNTLQLFRNGTIRANFATNSYRGSYSASAIANPEPSAALLFPLGLAVVSWAYRKKPSAA